LTAVILNLRLVCGKYLIRILLRIAGVHDVGVPHKVLEELICILFPNHETSSLDDIATVLNELAAFG
jgi:hypothetical protein